MELQEHFGLIFHGFQTEWDEFSILYLVPEFAAFTAPKRIILRTKEQSLAERTLQLSHTLIGSAS